MAIQKTEAFVLRTQPFRSSSLIVTFFSRSFGKIRGLAKGVRQEREMRGAIFELFTCLEIIFYEKTRSDLHLISEASILESYESVRSNLSSIAYASYFSELVDELSEVHDPHDGIFDLLSFAFRYLPSIPGDRLARIFEIRLLHEIGWLPFLEGCLNCREAVPENGFFSARQGGLYCARCAPNIPDARPISQDALSHLRFYADHAPDESIRRNISKTTSQELEALMNRFLLDRLNRPLKSRLFFEKIKLSLSNAI